MGHYQNGLAVLTGRRSVSVGEAALPSRISPVTSARIPTDGTRRWGALRPGHQDWNPLHAGVDLMAPVGTPVLAPEAGVILAVARESRSPWTGYAPCVFMAGDSGRFHLLAHLSGAPLTVTVGQRVALGAELGRIGEAEHHTHWEVRTRDHRATHEPAIANSLSPSEWLLGRDVPIASPTVPTEEVATLPVPSAHVRTRVPERRAVTGGDVALGLTIGVVGGLITWVITRE